MDSRSSGILSRPPVLAAALAVAYALGYAGGRPVGGGHGGALVGAAHAADTPTADEQAETCRKLDVFAKVLHYVQTSYVEPVQPETLVYGGIKGMLDTLDPHTVFMPPDVYREMKIDTTGEFQGLGLVIEQDESSGAFAVVAPLDDSPAARAGVRAGDVVLKVDDTPTTGLTLSEVTRLMRGPVGSTVHLTLRRDGGAGAKELHVRLVRQTVQMKSIDARMLDQDIGYVRIHAFQDRTTTQLRAALDRLDATRKGKLAGLVMDLRDNPGGLFEQGVYVADVFLDRGDIVFTRGRNPNYEEVERAHPTGTRKDLPLAVVINGGTASAAEIVSGALQDHKRGVLVGERSFGKGSVQNIIDLQDGSGLKMTVAHYYTPKRRNIHRVGIEPDRTIAAVEPENPEGETKLLLARREGTDIPRDDAQLWAAYNLLRRGDGRPAAEKGPTPPPKPVP